MKLILLLVAVTISLVATIDEKHYLGYRRRSSLSIINGKEVSIEKYPYMVALFQDGSLYGSGVILNKRWILTAAFSVAWCGLDELMFRVGSTNYTKGGQVLYAEKVIYHPKYYGWDYDIAVVKVNETIKFGSKVKAVTLGTKNLKAGKKVELLGWGSDTYNDDSSEVLLGAKLRVYSRTKCNTTYPDDWSPTLMCTYNREKGPGLNDWGDPLVLDDKVYGLYVGGYGLLNSPMLYANIPNLHKWISSSIKEDEL